MTMLFLEDYLTADYGNKDGNRLRKDISKRFDKGEDVTVSFKNVKGINTSFINSAFIDLLDTYSFSFIRQHLNFVDTTKHVNRTIKERFLFESEVG